LLQFTRFVERALERALERASDAPSDKVRKMAFALTQLRYTAAFFMSLKFSSWLP